MHEPLTNTTLEDGDELPDEVDVNLQDLTKNFNNLQRRFNKDQEYFMKDLLEQKEQMVNFSNILEKQEQQLQSQEEEISNLIEDYQSYRKKDISKQKDMANQIRGIKQNQDKIMTDLKKILTGKNVSNISRKK